MKSDVIEPDDEEGALECGATQRGRPILSEVVKTQTGVYWRRVDPLSQEVQQLAEFPSLPEVRELLDVADGYEVLVELPDGESTPPARMIWIRIPALGGWAPSIWQTQPLLALAMLERGHRERVRKPRRDPTRVGDSRITGDGADRARAVGAYQQMMNAKLRQELDSVKDLRIGEHEIDPSDDWLRTWSSSDNIAETSGWREWGERHCRWYERSYLSRTLRYFAYPNWGRIDLPIVMQTDHGWIGADLGGFDVRFPKPVEATLSGNYLLLCGDDGYGYRGRLYELTHGGLIWSSGKESYTSFWPCSTSLSRDRE